MEEDELWETFRTSGQVADYLRYRGIDLPAVKNAVERGAVTEHGHDKTRAAADHHRRTGGTGI
jgi:hypothetical protein